MHSPIVVSVADGFPDCGPLSNSCRRDLHAALWQKSHVRSNIWIHTYGCLSESGRTLHGREARRKSSANNRQAPNGRGLDHPQWLDATYEALSKKNSNLQIAVGAIFRYERCPDVYSSDILNHIASVWIACKPLIQTLISSAPLN